MKKEFADEINRISEELDALKKKIEVAGAEGAGLDDYDFEEVLEALDTGLCGLDEAIR